MKTKFFTFISFIFLFKALAFGQQAKMNPFAINSSNLLEDVKVYKTTNSNISVEELVKNANLMLENKGLNYNFLFDQGVCQKVEQIKQTSPDKPVVLRTTLKSVTDETVSLLLPEAQFEKSECGRCFVKIPALSMTEKDFVTKI